MSLFFPTRPAPNQIHRVTRQLWHTQWVRYLVAGAIAAMIDMGIFHVLATWVIPCVDGMQADSLRSLRFMTDKTLAFLIANTASFWMNTQWVFESGRHRKSTEVALFVSVSLLSYGVGLQLGRFLIERFATNSHVAAITCIGAATVLNYIIRKSVVFRS